VRLAQGRRRDPAVRYPNPLHPDADHRAAVKEHLKKVITASARLDVNVVNTFIGGDRRRTQSDNWEDARKVWPIDEFGGRFYHLHAKDLEIDETGLYEHGIMSAGIGWQVPRLPGLGQVQWDHVFSRLYRVGYDYVCCVEHEDRDFEGSDDLVKRGFLLARDRRSPYVV
jgi:sugar phosphate isomerase/epimerase